MRFIRIYFPRIVVIVLFSFTAGNLLSQNVIEPSDPSITTDTLHSGSLILGINSNGGGVINYLSIPGTGNIFGPQSVRYGRSGQSAMRDELHDGKYNPTQAGFNETLGTKVVIEKYKDKLIIPARPAALWHGDGQWDFCQWENIGSDPPVYDDNGFGDVDELDEYEYPQQGHDPRLRIEDQVGPHDARYRPARPYRRDNRTGVGGDVHRVGYQP